MNASWFAGLSIIYQSTTFEKKKKIAEIQVSNLNLMHQKKKLKLFRKLQNKTQRKETYKLLLIA